jgi:NADH-quinone oxidoreductase subunit N
MVVGNFGALRTRVAQRILAYTAVAHAGFLLIALVGAYAINREGQVAWTDFGVRSLIYYLVAYVIATLGAWGVLAAMTNSTTVSDIDNLHGLHRRNSGLAWLFLIFVLSLAGIPPFGGFWARFFVAAGWETGAPWLVIVGVITILLSAVAYLRLVRATFAAPSSVGLPMMVGRSTRFALIVAALFVIVMGIFPTLFLPIIETAAQAAPPQ